MNLVELISQFLVFVHNLLYLEIEEGICPCEVEVRQLCVIFYIFVVELSFIDSLLVEELFCFGSHRVHYVLFVELVLI